MASLGEQIAAELGLNLQTENVARVKLFQSPFWVEIVSWQGKYLFVLVERGEESELPPEYWKGRNMKVAHVFKHKPDRYDLCEVINKCSFKVNISANQVQQLCDWLDSRK